MTRISMLARTMTAATLVLAISAAPVSAQEEPPPAADFQSLVDQGVEHYTAREYEQAIEAFQQAFALRPEPDLVYNIARSYERLARRDDAIREYERFVELPGTTSELRARALASLSALRQEQRALDAARRAREEREATPEPTPAESTEAAATRTPPPPAPRGSGTSGLSIGGWTLFGTGAVTVAVGAVFGVLAVDRNDAFERATTRSEQLSLRDEVKTYALVTDVLLFGGGAIALTGLVLALVGANEGGSDEQARAGEPSVTVLASPEVVGLAVDGRF